MEELKCSKCNSELEEKYNYCPVCGEPLNDLAVQNETAKIDTAGIQKLLAFAKFAQNSTETMELLQKFLDK